MMRASRRLALALLAAAAVPAAAQDGERARSETFAQLPDWGGQWLTENDETSIGGFSDAQLAARAGEENVEQADRTLFGFAAPWNETGKQRMADARAKSAGRKAAGWGFPLMMQAAAPIQVLITPEAVLMINAYRDVRIIRTDGQGHPPEDDLWPTTWGDSVGHWEGDTLVVDTIMVRNPNDYFHGAPPLSDDAHYRERIRREGDRLIDEMTIEDPTTLSRPWSMTLRFQPAEGFDRMILDTYDNDRTGFDGEFNTIEPDTVEGETGQ